MIMQSPVRDMGATRQVPLPFTRFGWDRPDIAFGGLAHGRPWPRFPGKTEPSMRRGRQWRVSILAPTADPPAAQSRRPEAPSPHGWRVAKQFGARNTDTELVDPGRAGWEVATMTVVRNTDRA
jgi:hypothetical protein